MKKACPAQTSAGAEMVYDTAAPPPTRMSAYPVIPGCTVSVAVSRWLPSVRSTTPGKKWVPASPAVKV